MDPIEPVNGSPDPHEGQPPSATPSPGPTSYPRQRAASLRSRRPSIRLQRLPSFEQATLSTPRSQPSQQNGDTSRTPGVALSPLPSIPAASTEDESWQGNRRRSNSEPRPGRWSTPNPAALARVTTGGQMRPVQEEASSPIVSSTSNQRMPEDVPPLPEIPRRGSRTPMRWASGVGGNRFTRNRASTVGGSAPAQNHDVDDEYRSHIVDVLDVIDPEVSALSTLTNVQNSLFIPNLGPLLNRNQTYTLSPPSPMRELESTSDEERADEIKEPEVRPSVEHTLTSVIGEGEEPRFAVLPEGSNLAGWSPEEIEELNDHVRHMLHSRRSKFKRSMKGFRKYVSKPLGFLVTLYATLITLFGLAWVLFLIGWINVGGRQSYIINVIDNVLVALFAIMGDGLAPFRAIDTYHMIFIARYTFLTWKIRRKRHLPDLKNKNDLPSRRETDVDVELGDTPKGEEYEFTVLDPVRQLKLIHHQNKLSKSHTFYKPHETFTHYAFPMRLLIAIVVLLDCHSLFQIALGTCTWAISYHVRPFALTTVILCCSICCNITGGVLIMIGDRMTRKKDVVERLFRQQLTEEAMKKIRKKKRKEEERRNAENSGVSRSHSISSQRKLSLSQPREDGYES
ncbi:integral membrane protein [Aspergillus piperis CBS 112811]|uniref:Integral membrane protein n=1 Tax=Aspergillus piperis CBS 112811 TaxID=1448313 RepID=A0A8G1QZU4_9EURO|nr:integral membrane protein [Aspergillus piperis CBS 112811]RAH56769.1 integral membrane protein [Aspergillus piperis CBS 112811]